ncbi:hypothetical protein Cgig2_001621 [Carnegiea gigantea]|uniref:Uncharacterized protein n=1 Tax=Carnegiea gigantea TaxID=171969 RepID=A0A9Q1GR93_9CARY|nr:hypothetical protein Cgig2_001621 [Carnegiea gigantea]
MARGGRRGQPRAYPGPSEDSEHPLKVATAAISPGNTGLAMPPSTQEESNGTVHEKEHNPTREDIEGEIVCWQSAVICYVLGANPPYEVIEGMLRYTQENYRKQETHRKGWRVRSQVQPQDQDQSPEGVEPREEEDFQLVTRHITRYYVTKKEGQEEITSMANTYNVLLEKEGNQAEGGEGGSQPQMDKIISSNVRGMNGPNKQEDIKIFL